MPLSYNIQGTPQKPTVIIELALSNRLRYCHAISRLGWPPLRWGTKISSRGSSSTDQNLHVSVTPAFLLLSVLSDIPPPSFLVVFFRRLSMQDSVEFVGSNPGGALWSERRSVAKQRRPRQGPLLFLLLLHSLFLLHCDYCNYYYEYKSSMIELLKRLLSYHYHYHYYYSLFVEFFSSGGTTSKDL